MQSLSGRKQITAEQLFNHYYDRPAYLYSKTHAENGLDPWLSITGVDKLIREDNFYDMPVGTIIIEYGTFKEFLAEPSYNQIFVQE